MEIFQYLKDINFVKTFYYSALVSKRMSIFIARKVKIKIKTKNMDIKGRIFIGKTWHGFSNYTTVFVAKKNSNLKVEGNLMINAGCNITIEEGAKLLIGSGYINSNTHINCFNNISIGNKVLISENVTIRDSDNHTILYEGYEMSKPITIGDHVWIGLNVTILKGVTIGNDSIIAAGSVVTKDIPAHCLAAGVPAKVIKRNIEWE